MTNLVLDTSIIVKWFDENEDEFTKAADLLGLVSRGEVHLVLPCFAQLELINVLKHGKKLPQTKIDEDIADFFALQPEFIEIDDMYAIKISDLLAKYKISSYDAAFLAVAANWEVPLFTADYLHHQKDLSKNIIWLKDWNGKL